MIDINILASLASVWSTVWPILAAIAVFLFLIMIHEFGHFIFAKMMGVRVNEFAIGFGPKLFSFGKGETKYSVRLLPLGGYCAMEGEDDDSDDSKAFGNKPVWRRILIVIAGALFNIILGFILVTVMTASGPIGTTTVATFSEDAVSPQYGLQAGDVIREVNGKRVHITDDITYNTSSSTDGHVTMQVKRGGELVDLDIQFNVSDNYPVFDFKVERAEKNVGTVLYNSFWNTVSMAKIIYSSFAGLIRGQYGLNEMSGPVGMVQQVSVAAKYGFDTFMRLAALITINLGIFNLFPIPGLDGGRLIFLIIEGVARKPVPKKYEAYIHLAGMALLLLLAVFLIFHDFFRIFTGG